MVKAYRANSLTEALEIINKEDCLLFSGGTDLMVKNKQWSGVEPSFNKNVVFIGHLQELKKIQINGEFLTIGAACTCTDIAESFIVPEYFKEVFLLMASPAIRNIATIGGNICNSSPAGDSLPLLYALDAELVINSLYGTKTVPISEFILGPGKNRLKSNEILSDIKIKLSNFNNIFYKKVGTRRSTALSKISFIGLAKVNDKNIEDIRIAFGAVAPTTIRSRDIEKKIINMMPEIKEVHDIKAIKQMYSELINPISDQRSTADYRKKTALRLLEKFLSNLIEDN